MSCLGLITRLALDSGEVGDGDVGRGEGRAFLLVAIRLGHGGGHHDDPPWARNLELQAPIVQDGHELCVAWPPQ